MNINDYRETIGDIKATESLKRRIKNALKSKETTKRARFSKQVIFAVATCLAVAVLIPILVLTVILPAVDSAGSSTFSQDVSSNSDASGLPKLRIYDISPLRSATGPVTFTAEDIIKNKFWTENFDIETFPVYRKIVNLDLEEAIATAEKYAKKLGITEYDWSVYPSEEEANSIIDGYKSRGESYDEESIRAPQQVILSDNTTYILVSLNGYIRISSDCLLKFPEEFDFSGFDAVNAQKDAITDYLMHHLNVTDIQSPASSVFNMGDNYYSIRVYNKDADSASKLLEYFTMPVRFSISAKGELKSIEIRDYKMYEKLGDYPLITLEEAKELLLKNHYISLSKDVPAESSIFAMQLYVLSDNLVLMPYYAFYIDSSEFAGRYGIYLVPAVRSEYLVNFPSEDDPVHYFWDIITAN